MRVALDGRPLQSASGGRGIGRYVSELAPRLAVREEIERLVLHLDGRRPDPPSLPEAPGLEIHRSAGPPGPTSLLDLLRVDPGLAELGLDLYHGTQLAPPRLPAGVARVMTVHDLVPLLVPGAVPPRAGLVFRLAFGGARGCERVLTVSHFTARSVSEHLDLPRERLVVTPLGVDAARFAAARGTPCPAAPRPYLLHVGGFDQEKNLEMLLRVMEGIAGDPDGPELVVAGEGGERARTFSEEARRRGLAAKVRLTGRLGERELAGAYAGALLFLFPSRWEGFGLPPLEAMAAGCPVVSSGSASLPEVVGEAGVLLPPDDGEAWIRAVRRLLADAGERASLSAAGLERAAGFTWEATAECTVAAYRRALEAA